MAPNCPNHRKVVPLPPSRSERTTAPITSQRVNEYCPHQEKLLVERSRVRHLRHALEQIERLEAGVDGRCAKAQLIAGNALMSETRIYGNDP